MAEPGAGWMQMFSRVPHDVCSPRINTRPSLCNLPPFTYIYFTLSYQIVFLANIQSYQTLKSISAFLTFTICSFSCFAKLISQLHSCKWTPRTANLIKFFAFFQNMLANFRFFFIRGSLFWNRYIICLSRGTSKATTSTGCLEQQQVLPLKSYNGEVMNTFFCIIVLRSDTTLT